MKIINRVCSLGGVGSSEILRHIENDNQEVIREHSKRKHTIHPKYLVDLGTKRALFLIGNPYNSIVSIFDRNHKIIKIHEISMNFGKLWFKNKEEMNPILNDNTTLDEYLNLGRDLFNMEEHLENWLNYERKDLDIIIVKYENLENHIEEVMKFLRCSKLFIVKKRNSNWELKPTKTKENLMKIYGNLKNKIDKLPSIVRKINKIL